MGVVVEIQPVTEHPTAAYSPLSLGGMGKGIKKM